MLHLDNKYQIKQKKRKNIHQITKGEKQDKVTNKITVIFPFICTYQKVKKLIAVMISIIKAYSMYYSIVVL